MMTLAACQAWHRGRAHVCQAPRADGALDWLGCPSAPTGSARLSLPACPCPCVSWRRGEGGCVTQGRTPQGCL